ncbi:hypothetical protein [Paenibacillus tuaregi]|nr:hypothetical protein [Paenibacillus tuaregi]
MQREFFITTICNARQFMTINPLPPGEKARILVWRELLLIVAYIGL